MFSKPSKIDPLVVCCHLRLNIVVYSSNFHAYQNNVHVIRMNITYDLKQSVSNYYEELTLTTSSGLINRSGGSILYVGTLTLSKANQCSHLRYATPFKPMHTIC